MRLRPVPLALGLTCLALAVVGVGTAHAAPGQSGQSNSRDTAQTELGEQLYRTGCQSCHGVDGGGVTVDGEVRGPSLEDAGEATAYYYLSTGRMPLSDPTDQPRRKPPAYDDEEIDALVAHVATLGDGPELPEVDLDEADLAAGGVTYRANCQACHSAFGSGGALSYGRAAPHLRKSEPLQVAAAVRAGPGQMPVFGPQTISDEELVDLVEYVQYLHDPVNAGGLQVGRNGPVPEGFIAWLFGIGGALLIVAWIGSLDPRRRHAGDER